MGASELSIEDIESLSSEDEESTSIAIDLNKNSTPNLDAETESGTMDKDGEALNSTPIDEGQTDNTTSTNDDMETVLFREFGSPSSAGYIPVRQLPRKVKGDIWNHELYSKKKLDYQHLVLLTDIVESACPFLLAKGINHDTYNWKRMLKIWNQSVETPELRFKSTETFQRKWYELESSVSESQRLGETRTGGVAGFIYPELALRIQSILESNENSKEVIEDYKMQRSRANRRKQNSRSSHYSEGAKVGNLNTQEEPSTNSGRANSILEPSVLMQLFTSETKGSQNRLPVFSVSRDFMEESFDFFGKQLCKAIENSTSNHNKAMHSMMRELIELTDKNLKVHNEEQRLFQERMIQQLLDLKSSLDSQTNSKQKEVRLESGMTNSCRLKNKEKKNLNLGVEREGSSSSKKRRGMPVKGSMTKRKK